MAEFLFEILCEEIPARMQVRAGQDLEKALTSGLEQAGLTVADVQVFTGPRRLVYVADIPVSSPDTQEERKGPRVGSPEQALAGFLRGAGLSDISEAEIRSDKKGDHYVAVLKKEGVPTPAILSELIPEIMAKFPWPKSMKSGDHSFRWVRPLQSMICLLDEIVVLFEVGGISTGDMTEGHRRLGTGAHAVKNFAHYQEVLEKDGHVILSHEARKATILKAAKAACQAQGLELVEDMGLLEEVAGLAEWPVVILGDMDPAFLELPSELIRLSMRTHQKYFAVKDPKTDALAPHFVVVANQAAPDGGVAIAQGNSRVLSARLADAQFFQDEDAKQPLMRYYDKLDTVVFHKKLGSIRDKAERVSALSRELAPSVGAAPDAAAWAAKLSKCDLVTQTVIEFPSLQGQIGRLMYERALRDAAKAAPQGEEGVNPHPENGKVLNLNPHPEDGEVLNLKPHPEVGEVLKPNPHPEDGEAVDSKGERFSANQHASIATAIEDHYKPQGPSDNVPTDPVAIAVALADKLDSLVGFWAIDEKPTGSKDPFALRRAALGVVRIILEANIRINLSDEINVTFSNVLESRSDAVLRGYLSKYGDPEDATDALLEHDEVKLFVNGWEMCVWKNAILMMENGKSYPENPSSNVDDFQDELNQNLLSFILDRLKGYLRDQDLRHDVIDSVYAKGGNDLVDVVNRIKAVQAYIDTPDGENLLAGYKRASNILKAEEKKSALPEGDVSAPKMPESLALFEALQTADGEIDAAISAENYTDAMGALANLRGPIDVFFTEVQVIADDTAVKENNLRLLKAIYDTAQKIADFDLITG